MTKPLISILVPIYNVEKYLPQCLDSLVNQTLKSIEIICLNDGSTDSSLEILESYAAKDDRIVIIDKPNSGYGDSMNLGLAAAKGKYIGIVESDDWIELDAFEKLTRMAENNSVDVVRANYFHNKNHKDEKYYYVDINDTGRVIDPEYHTWIFYQAPAIWSAIYRREFLEENDIKFLPTPGASYQDTGFNFKIWATTHRAYFTVEAFLHYRLDNEASSVNSAGKVLNIQYEYQEIENYLREHDLWEKYAPMVQGTKFGAYFWNIFRLAPNLLPEFIEKVKPEYLAAREDGLLYEHFFNSKDQWNLMNYILDHSTRETISYIRRLDRKMRRRKLVKKLWLKTHPNYRKQKELSLLIKESFAENATLRAEFEELRCKYTTLKAQSNHKEKEDVAAKD